MDDHRCAHVLNFVHNANGSGQNAFDMLQPDGTLDGRQPFLIVVGRETDFLQFAQTFAHHVNVVNVQENHFDILICIFRLIAAALGLVCNRIRTRTCVHNGQFIRLSIRFHNACDVLFVFDTSFATHTDQRLRASCYRRQRIRMYPRQDRQTIPRPKLTRLLQ